jgi:hypothetical protein
MKNIVRGEHGKKRKREKEKKGDGSTPPLSPKPPV